MIAAARGSTIIDTQMPAMNADAVYLVCAHEAAFGSDSVTWKNGSQPRYWCSHLDR